MQQELSLKEVEEGSESNKSKELERIATNVAQCE